MLKMTQQLTIDDIPVYTKELNSRQWKLHDFFSLGLRFKNEEELIEAYELWLLKMGYTKPEYSYNYFEDKKNGAQRNNMGSIRALRKDKNALRKADIIQKTVTDQGIAKTTEEEDDFFNRWWGRLAGELKLYHHCRKKSNKNGQKRLTFGKEREEIQTILQDESMRM